MKKRRPYHLVAEAYPVHKGKVLLVNVRKLGAWLPPGGHMKFVPNREYYFLETPEEAAIREAKEETGLDVEIIESCCRYEIPEIEQLPLPEILNLHNIDKEHDHLGFEYFCRIIGDDGELKPSREGPRRWFSLEELSSLSLYDTTKIPSNVRAMAIEAIKKMARCDEHEKEAK